MDKLVTTIINAKLDGMSDCMFDKFIDHSAEKRPAEQKMYLGQDNQVVLPAENIYSFLFGENPPGCARSFEGKQGRKYTAMGQGTIAIDPVLIPFKQNGKALYFKGFDNKTFWICEMAGRTKKGTLSIKMEAKPRPVLRLPWSLEFQITLVDNGLINVAKLHNWFEKGGLTVALGTFRPRFGRFRVEKFEVKK